MNAISVHSWIAWLRSVKRPWFVRRKRVEVSRKEQPAPPQGGTCRHRHSAFFELP